MRRAIPNRTLASAVLAVLALTSLSVAMYRASFLDEGSSDFQWSPSRILLKGESPYGLYLDLLARDEVRTADSPFVLYQDADYPPPSLVFLWPYAAFNWDLAKNLWLLSNLAFTVAFIAGVFRLAQVKNFTYFFLLTCLLVIGTPFRAALGNGQHCFISLAAFMWAVVLIDRSRVGSGLLLSVAWLKYTLTLPLSLIFLCKRRLDVVLIAGSVHALLWLFSSSWTDTPVTRLGADYLAVLRAFPALGDFDVYGLLSHLNFQSEMLAHFMMMALFVLTGFIVWLMRSEEELLILSFLSIASCIIIVHHEYDSVVLVIPMTYVLLNLKKGPYSAWFLMCVLSSWYFRKIGELADRYIETDLLDLGSVTYFSVASLFYVTYVVIVCHEAWRWHRSREY